MEKGEWQKGEWSEQQRLEALAKYLPVFTAPDFKFSEVVPAKVEGKVTHRWVGRLTGRRRNPSSRTAMIYGWVQSTDWIERMQTEEAQKLSQEPARMATATAGDLAKVLTVSLRRDRFMEGSLAVDFERGLITSIVARAHELGAANEAKPRAS